MIGYQIVYTYSVEEVRAEEDRLAAMLEQFLSGGEKPVEEEKAN